MALRTPRELAGHIMYSLGIRGVNPTNGAKQDMLEALIAADRAAVRAEALEEAAHQVENKGVLGHVACRRTIAARIRALAAEQVEEGKRG